MTDGAHGAAVIIQGGSFIFFGFIFFGLFIIIIIMSYKLQKYPKMMNSVLVPARCLLCAVQAHCHRTSTMAIKG